MDHNSNTQVFRRDLKFVYVLAAFACVCAGIFLYIASLTHGLGFLASLGIALAILIAGGAMVVFKERLRFVVLSIDDTGIEAPRSLTRRLVWSEIVAARREITGSTSDGTIDGLVIAVVDREAVGNEEALEIARDRFPDELDAIVIEIGDLSEADREAAASVIQSQIDARTQ